MIEAVLVLNFIRTLGLTHEQSYSHATKTVSQVKPPFNHLETTYA